MIYKAVVNIPDIALTHLKMSELETLVKAEMKETEEHLMQLLRYARKAEGLKEDEARGAQAE